MLECSLKGILSDSSLKEFIKDIHWEDLCRGIVSSAKQIIHTQSPCHTLSACHSPRIFFFVYFIYVSQDICTQEDLKRFGLFSRDKSKMMPEWLGVGFSAVQKMAPQMENDMDGKPRNKQI